MVEWQGSLRRLRRLSAAALAGALVVTAAWVFPAPAGAVTVTLHTSTKRSIDVPMLRRDAPRQQAQVERGYRRLVRRAEAVCQRATRKGDARRQPAVTVSKAELASFNRSRAGLNRLMRRLKLRSAPRIQDFSQVGRLWILRRLRRGGGSRIVSAKPIAVRLNCRFD